MSPFCFVEIMRKLYQIVAYFTRRCGNATILKMKLMAHAFLALTILLSVYSQLIIKWRMSGRFAGLQIPEGVWPKAVTLFTVLFDPFVFTGLVATFVSGLCWMATMSKLDISYAYPFTALGFVLVLVFSHFFFGESFNMLKLGGVLLIIGGIAIASRG